MGDFPHNMAQFIGFQYDFLRIIIIIGLAIFVGWQMRVRRRLRYDMISNNALLVLAISLTASALIAFGGAIGAAVAATMALNFGTILGLYGLAWVIIFIFNVIRRHIRNQNRARFIFKR